MTSNSNYSIGLQLLKPVHTAQFGRKLVLGTRRKWPRPRRDVGTSRDRLETETSRRDHNPAIYSITTSRFVDLLYLLCTGVACSDLTCSCVAAKNHFDTMYRHTESPSLATACQEVQDSVFFGKLFKIK